MKRSNLAKYRDYKETGKKSVAEYKHKGLNVKETTPDDSEEYGGRRAKVFNQRTTPAEDLKRGGPLLEAHEAPWHGHWDGGSATAEVERPYGHDDHLSTATKGREEDHGGKSRESTYRKHMAKD